MKLGTTENKSSLSRKLLGAKDKLLRRPAKVSGDILGNIAILKFDREVRIGEKKKIAKKFLEEHKSVSTILEKTGKFKGRLRTLKTKFLAGENTKEALYKENDCLFRFNVETCYFSPRLSTERKKVALKVKKNDDVLVMFGGVGPFAITIGKMSKARRIVSVELGRECSKYALQNVRRNKLQERIEVVQGDVRKKCAGLGKFDKIVMARPNLKDSFLDVAFPLVKKGGIIYYYGFYDESKIGEMKELILEKAKISGRKIKILKVERAGEIGPYKFRYRVDIKIIQ